MGFHKSVNLQAGEAAAVLEQDLRKADDRLLRIQLQNEVYLLHTFRPSLSLFGAVPVNREFVFAVSLPATLRNDWLQ